MEIRIKKGLYIDHVLRKPSLPEVVFKQGQSAVHIDGYEIAFNIENKYIKVTNIKRLSDGATILPPYRILKESEEIFPEELMSVMKEILFANLFHTGKVRKIVLESNKTGVTITEIFIENPEFAIIYGEVSPYQEFYSWEDIEREKLRKLKLENERLSKEYEEIMARAEEEKEKERKERNKVIMNILISIGSFAVSYGIYHFFLKNSK